MSRLTAQKAHNFVLASQAGKNIVENKFMISVENYIKTVSQQGRLFLFYTIPTYQFGLPIYNPQDILLKIGKRLVRRGFRVKLVGTNHMYIEWGPMKQATRTKKDTSMSQEARDALRKMRLNLSRTVTN